MKTTQVNDEKDVKTPATPVEKKTGQPRKPRANASATKTDKEKAPAKPRTPRQPRANAPEKEANAKDVLDKSFSKAQKGLLDNIAKAVAAAPRGEKLTTVHIMAIKHSEELKRVSARAFCQATNLPKAYGIEFIRVSQLSDRLQQCGLELNRL